VGDLKHATIYAFDINDAGLPSCISYNWTYYDTNNAVGPLTSIP